MIKVKVVNLRLKDEAENDPEIIYIAKWFELPCDIDDILDEVCGFKMEMEDAGEDEEGNILYEEVETDERSDDKYEVEEIELDDEIYELELEDIVEDMELKELCEFAEFWDELTDYNKRVFLSITEVGYGDFDSNKSIYNNGEYSYYEGRSLADIAEDIYYDLYGKDSISPALQNHIDWKSYAEDMDLTETEHGWIELH